MEENVLLPLYRDIQHHPAFQGVFSPDQIGKFIQFRALQFRNKAHGPDIDSQHGYTPFCGGFCHVQNRTVSAEADHQFRIGQLPFQP